MRKGHLWGKWADNSIPTAPIKENPVVRANVEVFPYSDVLLPGLAIEGVSLVKSSTNMYLGASTELPPGWRPTTTEEWEPYKVKVREALRSYRRWEKNYFDYLQRRATIAAHGASAFIHEGAPSSTGPGDPTLNAAEALERLDGRHAGYEFRMGTVKDAVASLDEWDRMLIEMHFFQRMSLVHIAQESTDYAYSDRHLERHISRILELLAESMGFLP